MLLPLLMNLWMVGSAPVPPSGGIPASAYARGPSKDDVRRSREVLGIIPKAQAIITDVARQQAELLRLDEQQRLEQLQRELALEGIEFDTRHLKALNAERERLIDAEIARRMQQLVARRNMTTLLMIAAAA